MVRLCDLNCLESHHSTAPLPPLLDAVEVLRLTSQACDAFRNQSGIEQRKLLAMLVKEAIWKGGELQMTLQEPFEQLRLSNHKKLNGMNGIGGKEGGFEEWLRRAKSWSLAQVVMIGRHVFSGPIDPGRLWRAKPGAWQVLDFTA